MSQEALQVVAAAGFALLAVATAWVLRLGLTRELAWAALRAAVQLTAVGAIIALVFHVEVLAFAFVAAMLLTAALTSGGRLRVVPGARRRVGASEPLWMEGTDVKPIGLQAHPHRTRNRGVGLGTARDRHGV